MLKEMRREVKKAKSVKLEETIERAYRKWEIGKHNVYVYLDLKKWLVKAVTGEDREIYEESSRFELIYKLSKDFIKENEWEDYADLITRMEYKKLKDRFGDRADYKNSMQLQQIGIDFSERLKEYLILLENNKRRNKEAN